MERDAGVEQGGLMPEEFYRNNITKRTEESKRLKSLSRALGWARLAVFLSAVLVPYFFMETFSFPFFMFIFLVVVLFVFLVKANGRLNNKIEFTDHIIQLNETELKVLNYEFEHLPDGKEFSDPAHDFAFDLDIFGKGSLFQYMNRTSLYGGTAMLAGKFSGPLRDKAGIEKQQKMIAELSGLHDFRQNFYALGKMTGETAEQISALKNISGIDLSFFGSKEKYLPAVFTPLSGIVLGLTTAGALSTSFLLLWFFAGLGITGIYFKRVTKVQKQLSKLGDVLSEYSKLINAVDKINFSSEGLKELKEKLSSGDKKASVVIRQLGKRINMLDQRLNMFLGTILNGFFLWDLYVTGLIRKWHEDNGQFIDGWFDILREFDTMNTIAGFRYNHPQFVFPTFKPGSPVTAKALGHPLIPEDERVNNEFDISGEKRIVIITGANMAGKSTFLRTIGVNLVLAGTGSVVAASGFAYEPMRLITSMRAIDSLYKHESYFFSELKRLKYIVDELKRGEKVFFILDEILKGTNSHDKTKGSLALTEKLLNYGASGIIATHDLELGSLAEHHPGKIVNQCFEVEFDSGSLLFDYKLRDGITTSHNATYLMKSMGLIE